MVAGPSGVGKGTVVKRLLDRGLHRLVVSVSATTRSPRPGETEGVDYLFVSDDTFDRMIDDRELLEWAPIVGHRSGTPARFVEERLSEGKDVVLEIDVEGARQVRARVPEAVLVFLEPPSFEELERRLRGRATEGEDDVARRLEVARNELDSRDEFDHVVVNDDLDRATDQVAAIIDGSRAP